MEAFAGGVHPRGPGATPERSSVLRPRLSREEQVAEIVDEEAAARATQGSLSRVWRCRSHLI